MKVFERLIKNTLLPITIDPLQYRPSSVCLPSLRMLLFMSCTLLLPTFTETKAYKAPIYRLSIKTIVPHRLTSKLQQETKELGVDFRKRLFVQGPQKANLLSESQCGMRTALSRTAKLCWEWCA